ncbi:MAG: LLM class flavin-dependent oxidoreductase [Deltaproteobacteria bacterium]|nr:LLM class flavin-dependent oxidoreductase [Deltaproteobacteria bacterium]MBW2496591.1 LLM class flavin-dependent oxidoreductase [Deltaproteobacteria bacterium]
MKFGVFYELQLPRPWSEDGEFDLVQQALDQVALADDLGIDHAWAVEHHFLEEYSHCSAPELFLAAASQRTSRIRLGHSIVQLTVNHPARVAEHIATLDLLSNGRVEFGVGEGATTTELHPFGRRFRDKRAVWEDAVRCLLPMFWEDAWEYHGEYFDFPLRNVVPKPRQRPHPPLWVACSKLETIRSAGRWGMGALGFQFVGADAARAWVHAYYNAMLDAPRPLADYQRNPNIAVVSGFMCAETDEQAQLQADGYTFFQFALMYYNSHGPVAPGTVDLWQEYLAWRETPAGRKMKRGSGLIGSPETLRRRLRKFAASNIDQVILLAQVGQGRHEDICSSLELFAREVMPEFQAMEPEHQEWKRAVLSRELVLEEIETPDGEQTQADQIRERALGGATQ